MSFFNRKDFESDNVKKLPSCLNCKNRQCTLNPDLQMEGGFNKQILFISPRPNKITDAKARHLMSSDKKLLSDILDDMGISLKNDCGIIHAVRCIGKDPSDAKSTEIEACSRTTNARIKQLNPKLIFTLGSVPLQSLFFSVFDQRSGGVNKFRGWCFPVPDRNFWVAPLLDLAYVFDMVEKGQVEYETLLKSDLENGLKKLNSPMPEDILKQTEIKIVSAEESPDILNKAIKQNRGAWTAFDYETTGIKPHAPGHKVISIATAFENGGTIVFLIDKTNKDQIAVVKEYLTTPKLKRIAHNMKFEHHWSTEFFRCTPVWSWDTQLAAHMIDNREGITGLKHQALLYFGIKGYEEDIKPFLTAKNSNAKNNIEKLIARKSGISKLLTYNAIDAITTLHLAKAQVRELLGKKAWEKVGAWNL